MTLSQKLTNNIHWIGVNDRRTHLFENLWPLEKGISYNAYLIKDNKNALIDTVEIGFTESYFERIDSLLNAGESIDYLIINHMEPDHSGVLKLISMKYPDITLVGNKNTFKFVRGFFGDFKNTLIIDEGDTLNLGDHTLTFVMTPMLHWPETMMTLEIKTKILFTGDVFGSFQTLDGILFDDEADLYKWENEQRRYYSNIVGKYVKQTQKALEKLKTVSVSMLAPTHGLIWRSNLKHIIDLYDKWSRNKTEKGVVIVFGSMYGRTERMAETIARGLIENGIKDVTIHDASKSHLSYILSDIWQYQGLILGSPAYNNGLYPPLEQLILKLEQLQVKDRILGIFGSATWSGGGVKNLVRFAEAIGWETVAHPHEAKYKAHEDDYKACMKIAEGMALRVLSAE